MNTDTGAIRPLDALTEEERASGKWVPVSDDLAAAAAAIDLEGATRRLQRAEESRRRQLEGLRKEGRR